MSAAQPSPDPASEPGNPSSEAVTGMGWTPAAPVRVLLIEDNLGFAYGIRDILMRQSARQFVLQEAHTLAAGLEMANGGGIDVVLLDLGLPDSTRMATFDRMHAHVPRVPIIILTVLDDDEVALQAMRTGAQDYLVKERIDRHLLARAIRYAVERARADNTLRDLSARLMDLQDAERRRIARDLHDSTAQTLAALSMRLSLLHRRSGAPGSAEESLVTECAALARQCSDELRTMAYLLHPPLLDELGLEGAVRDYCDGFAERSGIRVDLALPSDLGRLSKEAETTLFRVMQESLTNVHRHSGSRTASIRLVRSPSEVRLEVQDTGRGLPPGILQGGGGLAAGVGVGIAGMRERLGQLGGRLEIVTAAGGATVSAVLPIHAGAP
jgi:signal transduction histidine kinase